MRLITARHRKTSQDTARHRKTPQETHKTPKTPPSHRKGPQERRVQGYYKYSGVCWGGVDDVTKRFGHVFQCFVFSQVAAISAKMQ